MNLTAILFAILVLGSFTSIVYAHPDPIGVTVQTQNNIVLYTNELDPVVNEETKHIELFTAEWLYQNFVLILASVIFAIMMPVGTVAYKEDIKSLICN